jgi:hypothetical protein
MTDVSKYQQSRNGPLTPEAQKFLDEQRLQNNWSYKQLGERLGISGAFAHNILNKNMNITTNSYMPKIEAGIDRIKRGDTQPQEMLGSSSSQLLEHTYHVRDGFKMKFELPADLTEREADRLALFVKSIAR